MARIRSIHPGLFTDEHFAALSDAAQVFYLGLLTEADDQGIFEWKPVTLRMRLRPNKDGPIEPFLSELVAANSVSRYEIDGRHYGAIRNFRKFQRPKSPNSTHPITDDIRRYVGLSAAISEIDRDDGPSVPPKVEKSPQMKGKGEDVGEEGGDKKNDTYAFSGRVIRLTGEDFSRWQASFPNLNGTLAGELESRDAWLAGQPLDDRKKWFQSTAAFLAKRNREAAQPKATNLAGRAVL